MVGGAELSPEKRPPVAIAFNGVPRATLHELRTPLTSIRGYAQLLLRGTKNEEQTHRAYETIFREAERMTEMLARLSKVAEATLGSAQPGKTRFDLGQVAAASVESAKLRWPEHNLILEDGPTAEVVADPQYVGEAISTLIDNAACYSEVSSTVRTAIRVENGQARVAVEDEGIGIPEDELEAIFECFQRASNAGKGGAHAARGLGVGLYLARAAARHAGGHIWAESEPEQGSTFHLGLPLAS